MKYNLYNVINLHMFLYLFTDLRCNALLNARIISFYLCARAARQTLLISHIQEIKFLFADEKHMLLSGGIVVMDCRLDYTEIYMWCFKCTL